MNPALQAVALHGAALYCEPHQVAQLQVTYRLQQYVAQGLSPDPPPLRCCCPPAGFNTVADYYAASSSSLSVPQVAIPLLCLQADDDPIAPKEAIPTDALLANPNCILVNTRWGMRRLLRCGCCIMAAAVGWLLHCTCWCRQAR
jgi:hypothetical protein